MIRYSVVVPTIGRRCLGDCLRALAAAEGPEPEAVIVVDDRPAAAGQPPLAAAAGGLPEPGLPVSVLRGAGAGPAAARNMGWRRAGTEWIAFLDDDVRVAPDWRCRLADDLARATPRTAAVQGQISVPRPAGRRPTDWERGTMGLAGAWWITADMAYRRVALAEAGGFDERFPRAFREDSDLALRVLADGWQLARGTRQTVHPVRAASAWASVRAQAGNADDALMRAVHGTGWHQRARAAKGRRGSHALITAALATAAALAAARRPGPAVIAAGIAAGGTAEFAAARITPGPRTPAEVATMAVTSLVIPELACWHWLRGLLAAAAARPWPVPKAVLFDRDGTLIEDVPYNGDPALVRPVPGARAAVTAARQAGLRTGIITNQSGIARGLLTSEQARAVNARVDELLGPFDAIQLCPHEPADRCPCRKPRPGMVLAAAAELGVAPHECVIVGDIGADVAAARAAGTRAVLVPRPTTLAGERDGTRVAADLIGAVRMITGAVPMAPVWPPPDAGSVGPGLCRAVTALSGSGR